MPKVVLITTYASADRSGYAGDVLDVSKKEAKDLVEGGFARAFSAAEDATEAPEETAASAAPEEATSGPAETASQG